MLTLNYLQKYKLMGMDLFLFYARVKLIIANQKAIIKESRRVKRGLYYKAKQKNKNSPMG